MTKSDLTSLEIGIKLAYKELVYIYEQLPDCDAKRKALDYLRHSLAFSFYAIDECIDIAAAEKGLEDVRLNGTIPWSELREILGLQKKEEKNNGS